MDEIIGALIEVHRHLDPGLMASAYAGSGAAIAATRRFSRPPYVPGRNQESHERHKAAGKPSLGALTMASMNTSNIIVRLDAEHHAAEIEVRVSKDGPRTLGLENALRRIGLRPMRTVELSTPRHFVTRTRVARLDGFDMNAARVAKALQAVRELTKAPTRPLSRAA